MKIVIIEDERHTAEDLEETIKQVDRSIEVVASLKSVEEGKAYFKSNPLPDLIFSDILLGDGLSFEILNELRVPVIFCTAYDEYALNAFKANGIDYMLKPFTASSVEASLEKFRNLTEIKQEELSRQYESLKWLFSGIQPQTSSLLIHYKDSILPISITDIALFHLESDVVSLTTFNEKIYYPSKSLDELEELAGNDFFRVNRQYLLNRKAILKASNLLSRKLSISLLVPHKDSITVSREKAPLFLRWWAGGSR